MASQSGQATIEWTGLVLLVALALAAALAVVPAVDGRSLGSVIAHSIVCAARGDCDRGSDRLVDAYGREDAELLRRFAPNIVYEPGTHTLPVDFRRCRSHRCSDAPDDQSLEVSRSTHGGVPAAAFTHLVRSGGATFLQYWFYYPDSNTVLGPSSAVWNNSPLALAGRYPGFHRDDWEGYQVRIDSGGQASVRATSHHGYQGCKQSRCENRWTAWTGWTRVSKGSHAGHIPLETEWEWERARYLVDLPRRRVTGYRPLYPGRDLHERTTAAAALDLIPLETLPPEVRAETRWDGISPPWLKEVYLDPLSNSTS
jgi:hypothetical protein